MKITVRSSLMIGLSAEENMNTIERIKPYVGTLIGSKKYMLFVAVVSGVYLILVLLSLSGVFSPVPGFLMLALYLGILAGSAVAAYRKLKGEAEINRIRVLLTGEMLAMAKEIETRILEIKKLWRQFSSRPIFCATELEQTRQTVYRKFLQYQKQQSVLNSLPDNTNNEEIREARAELETSIGRNLKYLEDTQIRLNLVVSQIALLEADSDVENNSSLLTTIESLRESRKLLAEKSS